MADGVLSLMQESSAKEGHTKGDNFKLWMSIYETSIKKMQKRSTVLNFYIII